MDEKKLDELFRLEIEISRYYERLLLSSNSEGLCHVFFLNDVKYLKMLLKREDEFFDSLSREEKIFLGDYAKKKKLDLKTNNLFSEQIMKRIGTRIVTDYEMNDMFKKAEEVLMAFQDDRMDIILSFLDETIDNTLDDKIKFDLKMFKYRMIYLSYRHTEKRVADRDFMTGRSFYLTSLMYADVIGYSRDAYFASTDSNALVLYNSTKNIGFGMKDGTINSILKCNYRTSACSFSDEGYMKFIASLKEDADFLSRFNEFFEEDVIQLFDKDRERRRVLSLKR